jgi:hypothetical protein
MKNAVAGFFSIFLINLLSTNSVVGDQGGLKVRTEMTPDAYQKYAQQQANPEPRPAPIPPTPPANYPQGVTGQAAPESRPPAVGQAMPETRPPVKKKAGSAKE